MSAVESYLADLVARCPGAPLIDELDAADLGTELGTATIARAALAWLRSKRADVIERDLRHQLAADDLLVRWRIRQAGFDIRGDTDWVRVQEVIWARTVTS